MRRHPRPRVVVVGGGFAGLSAVRGLSRVDADVLLLDSDPYNTFQPLLYQVATGGLNPGDITYALRAFASRFPNARFRQATVTGVDAANRTVLIGGDGADSDIVYDYLVICTGVNANYFGIPGAAEFASTIYTPHAAMEVRDRLLTNLEAVAQGRPDAVEPVVVIVGGGATGVEMAGAIAELHNTALPVAYPELDRARARVVLVEMADTVLGPFDARLRGYAARELEDRGVELRLNTSVKEVHQDCVLLADGAELPSAVTVWAAGVTAPAQLASWGLPQGRGGRFAVEPDMRVVGHPEIFAVGDAAASVHDPLPQLAQPAIQGGRHAAIQIGRLLAGEPTEPLRYRDKGTMATIGRNDAVVEMPLGIRLTGLVAWLAWLLLHIVSLVSNRNRLATLANLSIRYFTWPRSLNVIVGDPPLRGD